ncbi:MAG: F0F1 ATP synthase subunit delta [Aureliella sp.]
MLIDWFTVAAQTLNFLVLVWLLKRFLYTPILDAIDAREQRIAAELADAAAKKAEAQKDREEFLRKNEEFDRQRTTLLAQATEEVNVERKSLLDQARSDSDALRAKLSAALQLEQQTLSSEFTRRTHEEVFAITRKTLSDLAGTDLEDQMFHVFIRRLDDLKQDAKQEFQKALGASTEPAVVRSAFELTAMQRESIQSKLIETLQREIPVRFSTVPQVISGIELVAGGRKVAWSVADYLTSMEIDARQRLNKTLVV